VLKVVIDMAVDKPGAARVLLLAVALVEERSKKVAMGMVAKMEREGLKWTCFQGQCTGTIKMIV
jgi:hypothetical protein